LCCKLHPFGLFTYHTLPLADNWQCDLSIERGTHQRTLIIPSRPSAKPITDQRPPRRYHRPETSYTYSTCSVRTSCQLARSAYAAHVEVLARGARECEEGGEFRVPTIYASGRMYRVSGMLMSFILDFSYRVSRRWTFHTIFSFLVYTNLMAQAMIWIWPRTRRRTSTFPWHPYSLFCNQFLLPSAQQN
jgi:hypothetical protein